MNRKLRKRIIEALTLEELTEHIKQYDSRTSYSFGRSTEFCTIACYIRDKFRKELKSCRVESTSVFLRVQGTTKSKDGTQTEWTVRFNLCDELYSFAGIESEFSSLRIEDVNKILYRVHKIFRDKEV